MNVIRLATLSLLGVALQAQSNITAIWANDGGDKVTKDELRATNHKENLTGTVLNKVWNGAKVTLAAAQNETVSFQVLLEAANAQAKNVTVDFSVLTGPNDAKIRTSGTDPMNFVNRPIELFYERYVQIQGLSFFGYMNEASQVPRRFSAPDNLWVNRPDHDKWYPDPLVPIEIVKTFNVDQGTNQGIWADVYVPKSTASGLYKGSFKVYEAGSLSRQIPVELTVFPFALPDTPSTKTMLFLDNSDIEWRYVTGFGGYAQWDHPEGRVIQSVMDKYYQLLHRHRISAIGENECPPADNPCDSSLPRMKGDLYTAANGYDGPGVGTPNGVYSIGTYGTWGHATYGVPDWRNDQNLFNQHLNNYGTWFQNNLPNTDYFIYLADEPPANGNPGYADLERWAGWIKSNTGPGHNVKPMSTISAVNAMKVVTSSGQVGVPSLQIPTTAAGVGNCPSSTPCNATDLMNQAYAKYSQPPNKFWMYNDGRPGVGSSMTEDDGISLRTWAWAQYKKGIDRWYYWEGNVPVNNDTYTTATTFGGPRDRQDASMGAWGNGTVSNGNGLMLYPGSDINFSQAKNADGSKNLNDPAHDSYGMMGPVASIRLKEWRRGIQDVEYLTLAKAKDAQGTQAIVNRVMPKALWENSVADPSWPITPVTWSSDPDAWESARYQLAQMIGAQVPTPAPVPTPVPIPVPSPTPAPSPVAVSAPSNAVSSWAFLVSRNSNMCMDTTGANKKIGGAVVQAACRNAGQQKFRFAAVAGGYRVTGIHSGLQLDIQGGPASIQDGATLTQYPYWGGTNEVFWLEQGSDGYYLIHPLHSNKCLDVSGSSKDEGAAVIQRTCTYQNNQKWSFRFN